MNDETTLNLSTGADFMPNDPRDRDAVAGRRELSMNEWARLRGVDDIARELVDGWDNGFPVENEHSATDLIDRLRPFLTDPEEPAAATPTEQPRDDGGPEHVAHRGNHEGYACGFSGSHCWACNEPWPCRAERLRAALTDGAPDS